MIDVRKINVVLPPDVTMDGEISISGNIATVTLLPTAVGEKEISVSYDSKHPVTATLHVSEETLFTAFTCSPADRCFAGDTVRCTAKFSKIPLLSDLVITPALGFSVLSEPQVIGNTIVADYTAPEIPAEGLQFIANFRNNTTIKTCNMVVQEKPAVLQQVTSNKEQSRITTEFKLTAEFDKTPKAELLELELPDGVVKQGEPDISDTTMTITLVGNTVGSKTIGVTYAKVKKEVIVEILADAVIRSAAAEPTRIKAGETSAITVDYDKARLIDQPEMQVHLDSGLAEKVSYSERPDRTGGTMVVMGGEAGDKTVTLTLASKPTIIRITVTE